MKSDKTAGGALGLDVGTSRICVAREDVGGFKFRTELNAFVTIPHSKMTENVLQRENVPHTVKHDQIIVHGNESEKFADMLDVEIRRPMTAGLLSPSEPESLSMMREILKYMVGDETAPRKLSFTVPAPPVGAQDSLTYHETTIRQILTELGYEVRSLNEGLAVIYSELESTNYTGIGVSCGGGLCNVCLAYLSVPVLSFSIPRAGDYIDMSAASVTGERANRIRLTKEESFHLNGFYNDKVHQVLGVYYDQMIRTLVQAMKEGLSSSRSLPRLGRPIPVVLSGGTTLPSGFRERFEKILREENLPLPISEVRMASEPLYGSAKGALIAALTDL
ncbi:MAG TPA: hypothetical protein VMJ34_03725 [Bryobacteraceae bacterium]|nr:hypothetical protein [Bryobacteraceae bacterium]